MICQNCQAELPEQARFCNQCGTPAPRQSTVQTEQDINTLKGTSIGVIDNQTERRDGLSISSRSKIGTIEEGGTAIGAILGGEGENVHVGGQQNYNKREINTSGGSYIGGNVSTGGDFVGRDKHVHGDEVRGDKIGGDKITMGNVSNATVAAGSNAQATSSQGIGGAELAALFDIIYKRIEARPDNPDVDKEELQETVQKIQTEASKGEDARPGKVLHWLKTLASIAPDILEVTVSSLINPVAGVAAAIRSVAERVLQDTGTK